MGHFGQPWEEVRSAGSARAKKTTHALSESDMRQPIVGSRARGGDFSHLIPTANVGLGKVGCMREAMC